MPIPCGSNFGTRRLPGLPRITFSAARWGLSSASFGCPALHRHRLVGAAVFGQCSLLAGKCL